MFYNDTCYKDVDKSNVIKLKKVSPGLSLIVKKGDSEKKDEFMETSYLRSARRSNAY